MTTELEKRVADLEFAVLQLAAGKELEFGDVQGHLFHGNQWSAGNGSNDGTGGEGNGGKPAGDPGATKAADAPFPRANHDGPQGGYGLTPSFRTRQYTENGRIMGGEMRGGAAAILPTGSSVNLHKPDKADFAENVGEGTTVHVVDIGRRYGDEAKGPNLRAVSSYGGPTWNVGDKVYMNHDQNPGRSLLPDGGPGTVVGIRHQDMRMEGDVPNKSMPHWVFK